ncbi:hypothetical protein HZA76_01940 [Candidatus Roizmanbacteria bacterium]|nr:hypothetical protein [Candidatus Roizmanbacteria bacterium]
MNERFKPELSGDESAIREPIRRKDKHPKNYPWSQVDRALKKPSKPWDPRINRPHSDRPHSKVKNPDHKQKQIKKVLASLEKFNYPTEPVYGQGRGGRLDTLMQRLEKRIKDPSQTKKTEGNNIGVEPYLELTKGLEQRYVIRRNRLQARKNRFNKIQEKITETKRRLYQQNRQYLKTKGLLANVIKSSIESRFLSLEKKIEAAMSKLDTNPVNLLLKRNDDSITKLPIQLSLPISDMPGIKSSLGKTLSIDPEHPNEEVFLDRLFTTDNNTNISQIVRLAHSLYPQIKEKDFRFFYPAPLRDLTPEESKKASPIQPRLKRLDDSDQYRQDAQTSRQVFRQFEQGFEEVPIVLVKDRVGNVLLELTFSYISAQKLGLINLRMPEQRNKEELLRRSDRWMGNFQLN